MEPSPGGGPFRMIQNLDAELRGNLCLNRVGRLWVGTMGMGLYCYDTTRFEVFGTAQDLPSDRVRCVAEDKEGTVWVGTERGLVGYDGRTFWMLEGAENLLTDHRIHSLWVDGGNRLWVSTWGGRLYMHEQGALHFMIETECLGEISLTEDGASRIWFGFHGIFGFGRGFGYYEHGAVRRFVSEDEGGYPRQIGAMLADRAGRLWIGSSSPRHWEGLRCYDIAALVVESFSNSEGGQESRSSQ